MEYKINGETVWRKIDIFSVFIGVLDNVEFLPGGFVRLDRGLLSRIVPMSDIQIA